MDTLVTVQIFLGFGYFQKWFAFPLPLFYIMIIMTVRQRKNLNCPDWKVISNKKNWTATYIHITVPYGWNSISTAWLKKLWQFSFIWTITQLTPQQEKCNNHQTHKGTNEIPKISTNKISVLKRSNTFCSTFLKNFRSYLWTSYYVRETFQIHHPTIFKLA